jgi:hypothetical protein
MKGSSEPSSKTTYIKIDRFSGVENVKFVFYEKTANISEGGYLNTKQTNQLSLSVM